MGCGMEPTEIAGVEDAAFAARQRAELELLIEGQRRLLEVSERVLTSLDPAVVLELIAESLKPLVWYDSLVIYEADWATHRFFPTLARTRFTDEDAEAAFMRGSWSIDDGIAGWVIRSREPLNLVDAHNDPRGIQVPGTDEVSEQAIFIPLMRAGVVAGTLKVSRIAGNEAAFTSSEFDLARLFASLASIALQNARTHHTVVFQADTDGLSGLYNHGSLQRDIRELVARGPTEPFALLLLDLDRFKMFNDTRGHPAGDELLRLVAAAIRESSREDDRSYRYGGDEFAVLLRRADARHAQTVARRVRDAIRRITAGQDPHVTASIGSACYPGEGSTAEDLLAAADAAMYQVKRSRGGSHRRAIGHKPHLLSSEADAAGAAGLTHPGLPAKGGRSRG